MPRFFSDSIFIVINVGILSFLTEKTHSFCHLELLLTFSFIYSSQTILPKNRPVWTLEQNAVHKVSFLSFVFESGCELVLHFYLGRFYKFLNTVFMDH